MSWFATLQAQPWFSTVQNEFATYAPSVSPALWEGELLSEDSSLNPAQEDYLNSGHFGLFQENASFPTTVGLPAATTAQLQNPAYNAYVAALAMQKAIANSGQTSLVGQVQALEQAGWPGAISTGETSTRVANVEQILNADGGAGAGTGSGSYGGYDWSNPEWLNPLDRNSWMGGNAGAQQIGKQIGSAEDAIPNAITGAFGNLGQTLLIGGLITGLLAGGFWLLVSSVNAGKDAPMPVPVPV
jgi:hypothetical protein